MRVLVLGLLLGRLLGQFELHLLLYHIHNYWLVLLRQVVLGDELPHHLLHGLAFPDVDLQAATPDVYVDL